MILSSMRRRIERCFSTFSSSSAKADFGFKEVDAKEKERLVRDVFSRVAGKYDIMNDLMSAGVHRLWKDEFVSMMGIDATSKAYGARMPRHLDVAGGTGDIAFRVFEKYSKFFGESVIRAEDHDPVVVCDINPHMLEVGKVRADEKFGDLSGKVKFVEGNAESLPFESNTFDVYSIAFGLRNVTNKDAALREAYRVLRPGGRALVLEFSHLTHPLLQGIYDQYSFNVIPKLGELVSKDAASYQYLVESIRKFPRQEELVAMFRDAGFISTSYTNMSFGVVAVHSGFKK